MDTPKQSTGVAFAYVTTLFFAWGFVTSTIDPLVPSVKSIFSLTYVESQLTQFFWFISYGLLSLPAAAILARLGFVTSIVVALATMVVGCLLIPVATAADLYPGVLGALFVIGSGVTLLQVAANPLVAALGRPARAHFRLTLSQAFNSLGTVLGPRIGSIIMLSGGVFGATAAVSLAASRAQSLRNIDLSFLLIGAFFAVLAIFIWIVRGRIALAAPKTDLSFASPLPAFASPWAVFGACAIFLYVGSEVTIGSFMISFLHQPNILGLAPEIAGSMFLPFYWGGAMVGRFVGSGLLTRVKAGPLLCIAALIAALLCLTITQSGGAFAAYAALSIGFFNSIMFPTIFTLTLERSSAPASATSGLLCMAIVGGAVLPLIAGHVADVSHSVNPAFFIPMTGYIGIVLFAWAAARFVLRDSAAPLSEVKE